MTIRVSAALDAYGRLIHYRDTYDAGLKPVISDVNCVNFVRASSQYIGCGTSCGDYDYNTPFSASFWYKSSTVEWMELLSKYSGVASNGWFIMVYNSSSGGKIPGACLAGLYVNGTTYINAYSLTSITSGAWKHAVVTYDGSGNATGIKHYVNGVLCSVSTTGTSISSTIKGGYNFRFGMHDATGVEYLNGKLNEVALYNKALSLSEVQEIYNAGKPNHLQTLTTANNLEHWWRMGDLTDAHPTIYDRIGSSDGTMVNMTSGNIVADAP